MAIGPHGPWRSQGRAMRFNFMESSIIGAPSGTGRRKRLDMSEHSDIMWITRNPPETPDEEPLKAYKHQRRGVAQAWLPSPSSRHGHPRAVRSARVLRSLRPSAGQVRDAAHCPCRGRGGSERRSRLRFVSAHLLPGAGSVRALWLAGFASGKEGTPSLPQAFRRGAELRHRGVDRGYLTGSSRTGAAYPPALRYYRSPAEHPAGPRSSQAKKNRVESTEGSSASRADIETRNWSELYERLRGWVLQPLGEPWSGPRPLGFGVFVRSGMCAWIETCSGWTPLIEPEAKRACYFPETLPQSVPLQLATLIAGTLLNQVQGVTR